MPADWADMDVPRLTLTLSAGAIVALVAAVWLIEQHASAGEIELAAQYFAERGAACVASLENNMACGFGVCLGCAAPLAKGGFALVCRDGPMFDAADVAWDGLP